MVRLLMAIVLAGGLGALAGNTALANLFGISFTEILSDLPDRGPFFAAAIGLPLLFWIVRGLLGWVFSILALTLGIAAALKFGVEDGMPWDQALTLTGTYAVVAVIVYKMTLGRLFD